MKNSAKEWTIEHLEKQAGVCAQTFKNITTEVLYNEYNNLVAVLFWDKSSILFGMKKVGDALQRFSVVCMDDVPKHQSRQVLLDCTIDYWDKKEAPVRVICSQKSNTPGESEKITLILSNRDPGPVIEPNSKTESEGKMGRAAMETADIVEGGVKYRDWDIEISFTPEYGTHPFEWHISKGDQKTNDPTSWGSYNDALSAAREAIDSIEAHRASGPTRKQCKR